MQISGVKACLVWAIGCLCYPHTYQTSKSTRFFICCLPLCSMYSTTVLTCVGTPDPMWKTKRILCFTPRVPGVRPMQSKAINYSSDLVMLPPWPDTASAPFLLVLQRKKNSQRKQQGTGICMYVTFQFCLPWNKRFFLSLRIKIWSTEQRTTQIRWKVPFPVFTWPDSPEQMVPFLCKFLFCWSEYFSYSYFVS